MNGGGRRNNAAQQYEDGDSCYYAVSTCHDNDMHPVQSIALSSGPNVHRHRGQFTWSGCRDKEQASFLMTFMQYAAYAIKRLIDMKVCCMPPDHPDCIGGNEANELGGGMGSLEEDENENEMGGGNPNARGPEDLVLKRGKAIRPPNPHISVTMTMVGMKDEHIIIEEEQTGLLLGNPPDEIYNLGKLHGIGALSQSSKDRNYTMLNSGGDSGYVTVITFSTSADESQDDKVRKLIQDAYDRLFLTTHQIQVLSALNDGTSAKKFFEANIGLLNQSTLSNCIKTYHKEDSQWVDYNPSTAMLLQHFSLERAISYARRKLWPMHSLALTSSICHGVCTYVLLCIISTMSYCSIIGCGMCFR